MILCTTDEFPGHEIVECLGLVKGNTVRATHAGNDFIAGLRNMVGGEVSEYTKLMAESREQSIDRMIAAAEELGADAIVCIRMSTSMVQRRAAEILVFGSAVRLKAKE